MFLMKILLFPWIQINRPNKQAIDFNHNISYDTLSYSYCIYLYKVSPASGLIDIFKVLKENYC